MHLTRSFVISLIMGALCLAPMALIAGEVAEEIDDCIALLASSLAPAQAALPNPLRIAVWNTRKFEHPGAADLLRQLGGSSDLLLLQESLQEAPDTHHGWRLFAAGYQTSAVRSGVEIRATAPADVRCTLQFTEPWLRTPKGVAVARFRLGDDSALLAITIHAINFTLGASHYRAMLAELGRLLRAHRGPVLLAGDFNHWNQARARALEGLMSEHKLQPLALDPDWRSRFLGRPVDAVLLRQIQGTDGRAQRTRSSDHHPITATLLWPPRDPELAGSDAAGS